MSDFITNGTWDQHKLRNYLPNNKVTEISAKRIPLYQQEDKLIWIPANDGKFSVKMTKKIIRNQTTQQDTKWIWKLNIQPKIKTFI